MTRVQIDDEPWQTPYEKERKKRKTDRETKQHLISLHCSPAIQGASPARIIYVLLFIYDYASQRNDGFLFDEVG